ncbi:MAG: surface-adhesin E family protein [Ramlibacter sp.]
MKHLLLALLLFACRFGHAEEYWFTVMGDKANPAVNTIEVNPVPLDGDGLMRTMRVRVSRSTLRKSWDGIPYRSYESTVLFDCLQKKAQYLSLVFYLQPAWQGPSHQTSVFTPDKVRPMLFKDVVPNPTGRIIRAACQ